MSLKRIMLLKSCYTKVTMNVSLEYQKKVITCLVLVFGILLMGSFVSANICSNEKKVFETNLIPNDSNYFTALPHFSGNDTETYNQYQEFWEDYTFIGNDLIVLSNEDKNYLVNGFNLEEGTYVARIKSGAWSLWNNDGLDTSEWVNDDREGGVGKTWQAVASVAYNYDGETYLNKFGNVGLYSTPEEAEAAGEGRELFFKHDGGDIYILINDFPTYDNRGDITIEIYQCDDFEAPESNCYWPPSVENKEDLFKSEYFGWANHDELATIIHASQNDEYIDETILCYDDQWHVTLDGWPYFNYDSVLRPWGILYESRDTIIGDWFIVDDPFWILKWTKGIVTDKIDLYVNNGNIDKTYDDENAVVGIKAYSINGNGNFPVKVLLNNVEQTGISELEFDSNGENNEINFGVLDKGDYNLKIISDPQNVIDEENEGNNVFEYSFKIYESECDDKKNNGGNHQAKIIGDFSSSVWKCSDWTECDDGIQTRSCTDLNDFENNYNKPMEIRGCEVSSLTLNNLEDSSNGFNWIFWLLIAVAVILLVIIITLILR